MYGYIYLISNQINGKRYIGQHKYDKPEIDPKYWSSGIAIKAALKKYGKANFTREYLNSAESKKELDLLEKEYIAKLQPEYNIADGGQGGFLGSEVEKKRLVTFQTKAFKEKISKLTIGHSVSEETKQKISAANTGHTVSEETRIAISRANKGRKRTEESKQAQSMRQKGQTSPFKGKHHTEASNKKCAESVKQYCANHPERNKAISEALRGKLHAYKAREYQYKKVICIETQTIYNSIKDAVNITHISQSSISHCCKGDSKTAGGYHWAYITEKNEEITK